MRREWRNLKMLIMKLFKTEVEERWGNKPALEET
jgi:hypothetical protein